MRCLIQLRLHLLRALRKAGVDPRVQYRFILTAVLLCASGLVQGQISQKSSLDTERAGEVVFVSGAVLRHPEAGATGRLVKGGFLQEGDLIQAQADGYVYVRMADGGLLVVRPMSELRIERWRFDPLQPELSEIRYTLRNGVARHVSGRGAQAAKDKFRFNTPLAAIGVRGTDFTVYADPTVTQVVVRSGGVVVSGFGGACLAEALGPCGGVAATELFASNREKMIQFRQGDTRPELVDVNAAPSPDKARPPAASEPVASRHSAGVTDVAIEEYRAQQVAGSYTPHTQAAPETKSPEPVAPSVPESVVLAPVPLEPEPVTSSINAVWGNISAESGPGAQKMVLEDILRGRSLIASNRYYALAGSRSDGVTLPDAGSAEFKLASHQGVIVDKGTKQAIESEASNGFLRIDFSSRKFESGFDLQAKGISTRIEGAGSVGTDGTILSAPFLSQTLMQGMVSGSGAAEAVYIYQRSLSKQFDAAGVASWTK